MSEMSEQQRLVEALKQPAAFGLSHDTVVEFHETHISFVFLAGEFAYKIKKAIRTPFLDYSTLALRRRDCELELKLNQRYAAELYLVSSQSLATVNSTLWVPMERRLNTQSHASLCIRFAAK